MATYDELLDISGDTNLLNKVRVATIVAATLIVQEETTVPNHDNRLIWAKSVFRDPIEAGLQMMWPVLALNRTATTAVILAADDATVQNAVNSAVNVFAQGA